ncbi:IPExxxVDY family protein [Bizionia sediminis]|uniref:IPExxxVDY family protein n=1 Tax=Bizionia sediminis TaxID=1737064 RepID=A0ABW5KQW4_9FLAO
MQKLNLDDFEEPINYTLIGIHSNLEGYRLAYFLNKELQLQLVRQKEDLDFKHPESYEIYEWTDALNLVTWHLVSNICSTEQAAATNSHTLFSLAATETKTYYLIPEYKKVNFFLKISDKLCSEENVQQFIKNLQNIPNVVTAYSINPTELKSKNNLIFY